MADTLPLPPVPALPARQYEHIAPGVMLLRPLSRKGTGPGLIVLPSENTNTYDGLDIREGVPSPLVKWAEEGYTVVEIAATALSNLDADPFPLAFSALQQCDACTPKEKTGLVCYEPRLWKQAATRSRRTHQLAGVVLYDEVDGALQDEDVDVSVPLLHHIAGKGEAGLKKTPTRTVYYYPEASSHLFATPFQAHFRYSTESVSHTRNLTFLKKLMDGPYFDLEAIWDEHTYWEFENRSVEHTMATMVQEPYVNHLPTLTGGIGRAALTDFYRDHFIFANPADTELELVSRTIGIDRVMDEFIFKFTHDRIVDWLFPGVPPTFRKVQIPFSAVVNIRGDRLYHEHISWDQLTALMQVGLMPAYLPFSSEAPNAETTASEKRLEYRVPGAGRETAEKLADRASVPSNKMFDFSPREVDKQAVSRL